MHRLRGIAVVVVLVISLSCVAFAQGPAKCDFETELGKIYSDAEAKRVKLADQQSQVLDQLRKLINKLPDQKSDKPVAEQLDKEGVATFERLRERQLVLMNVSLSESRRMRDMQFFRKFVILAEKDVRWPEIPPQNSPDYDPYVVLGVARSMLSDMVEISEGTKYDQCTLEASIQVMEQEVIDRVNSMDGKPVFELQMLKERLEKKYKTKALDIQKMSKSDQKALRTSLERIEPIQRLYSLEKDYEILKALAKASQLIYDMDKEDIHTYGAAPDKIGTTLFTKANAGEYGELMKSAHAVMRVVDKRIPCDDALALERIKDAGKK
jgi:hypothetical protein